MLQAIVIGFLIILGIGLCIKALPYAIGLAVIVLCGWLIYNYWKIGLLCLGGLIFLAVFLEKQEREKVRRWKSQQPQDLSPEKREAIIIDAVARCIVDDANENPKAVFREAAGIPHERAAALLSKFSKNISNTKCYYLSVAEEGYGTLVTDDGIYICFQSDDKDGEKGTVVIPFSGLQKVFCEQDKFKARYIIKTADSLQSVSLSRKDTTVALENITSLCEAIMGTPLPLALYHQRPEASCALPKELPQATQQHALHNFDQTNTMTREILSIEHRDCLGDPQSVKLLDAIKYVSDILEKISERLIRDNVSSPQEVARMLEPASMANQEIARRLADKHLYVCIMGEFSCGKSTFINAMLEQRFLIEDVLQGTTCSKTVIRYAPKENITVFFSNNTRRQMRTGDSGDILLDAEAKREFLRAMTAEEEKAREIDEVLWESPIEVLSNGLCIIDTPGIGSQNPRHTEVARSAGQQSDALLVLTGLDKALSKDLLEEVTEIAGPEAANCIFIGTRKDQFPPREVPRMRRHFRQRLSSRFGHECQFAFVSAYKALEELEGKSEERGALEEFRQFRAGIRQALESNRKMIQSFKASAMINKMVEDITGEFSRKKQEFDRKIAEYQAMVIPEDSDKWATWEKRILSEFDQQMREINIQAQEEGRRLLDRLQSDIFGRIDLCDDTSEIKECCNTGIPFFIARCKDEVDALPDTFLHNPMKQAVEKATQDYAERFQKEYEKLEAVLGNAVQVVGPRPSGEHLKVNVNLGNSGFASVSADIESEENFKIGGGLATAAGLSFLIPGVGWVAGAFLTLVGGVLGAAFLKSVDTRKKELKEKVESSIASQKEPLQKALKEAYSTLRGKFRQHLIASVEAQKSEYVTNIQRHNQSIEERQRAIQEVKVFLDRKIEALRAVDTEIRELKSQISLPFTEKEETEKEETV